MVGVGWGGTESGGVGWVELGWGELGLCGTGWGWGTAEDLSVPAPSLTLAQFHWLSAA